MHEQFCKHAHDVSLNLGSSESSRWLPVLLLHLLVQVALASACCCLPSLGAFQSSACMQKYVPTCWSHNAPYQPTSPTQPHCAKHVCCLVRKLCDSFGRDVVLLLLVGCRTVRHATLQPLPRISKLRAGRCCAQAFGRSTRSVWQSKRNATLRSCFRQRSWNACLAG